MSWSRVAALAIVLLGAPLMPGIATRCRALLTGRRGAPVLQLYYELFKLLRKHSVFASTTTWVFRWTPPAGIAALLFAATLLPLDGRDSIVSFAGDFFLFAGLLALGRFALILAALDTASSFEGMGASRDAMVSTFAEPGLLLGFGVLVLAAGSARLTDMLGAPLTVAWASVIPSLAVLAIGMFVLLLAESSRVPVDDPATHLELTMIHEVAILDHSGPGLALMLYGAALKFTILAAIIVGILIPRATLPGAVSLVLLPLGIAMVAVLVGVVESVMARLRLVRVPLLLVSSTVLVAFAAVLLLGRA